MGLCSLLVSCWASGCPVKASAAQVLVPTPRTYQDYCCQCPCSSSKLLEKTLKPSQASLAQSLWGTLLLSPGSWLHTRFSLWHPRVSGAFPTVSPLSLDVGCVFFGGLQPPPINGCSAPSCDFDVLTEDECMALYASIFYKPLIIHQRADRRSKNYNHMASRTKITITGN